MRKVICINKGSIMGVIAPQLTEGRVYTVVDDFGIAYKLLEVESDKGFYGFWAKRFIPTSGIDETEMIRNYKTETA